MGQGIRQTKFMAREFHEISRVVILARGHLNFGFLKSWVMVLERVDISNLGHGWWVRVEFAQMLREIDRNDLISPENQSDVPTTGNLPQNCRRRDD